MGWGEGCVEGMGKREGVRTWIGKLKNLINKKEGKKSNAMIHKWLDNNVYFNMSMFVWGHSASYKVIAFETIIYFIIFLLLNKFIKIKIWTLKEINEVCGSEFSS